jgi:putative oxidoreductase
MNLWHFWQTLRDKLLEPAGLLLLRLWLAQEFIHAGITKLSGGLQAPEWFAALTFPVPVRWLPADMNWVTAGVMEITFGTLLLLGLGGRVAALALLFVTWVAVYSVHFDLGWAGWQEIDTDMGLGFKVPLMMAVMLFALLAHGMGRWSLDAVLLRRYGSRLKGWLDLSRQQLTGHGAGMQQR